MAKKNKTRICLYCGGQYSDQNVDIHMHSYLHHEGIEHLKLRGQHACLACKVSVTGLKPYKEHISTRKHTNSLYNLHKKKSKQHLKAYNISLTKNENVALQRAQHKNKRLMERCFVCCQYFAAQNLDEHMHSTFHHERIEKLKGGPQVHKCWACGTLETGMAQYEQHLGTSQHKFNMFALEKDAAEGKKVDYNAEIDDELRSLCDRRDQMKKKKKVEKRMRILEIKHTCTDKQNKNKRTRQPEPAMANTPFTNDYIHPSFHLLTDFTWQHQNDHSASIELNQNMPEWRQESVFDMNSSNEPLVKRPCFKTPSAFCPKKVAPPATHPIHEKGVEVWVNTLLSQSRIEASKPTMTTAGGETAGNEAVVPSDSLKKHSHANESDWTFNRTASQSEMGTSDGLSRQEPHVESLQSATSLAETFASQTSENDWPVLYTIDIQTRTVCVKEEKSHESLDNHNSYETNSCNIQKKQEISYGPSPETNNSKVNKLLTLSSKEDELSRSLEHVGGQLIEAYSTLESVRAEVQHLLAVKQQITSELASLREKRLKILQHMKDTSERSSNSDQQVALKPPDSCVKL